MKNCLIAAFIISLIGILGGCAPVAEKKTEIKKPEVLNTPVYRSPGARMSDMLKDIKSGKAPVVLPASSRIDTVKIDSLNKKIDLVLNSAASGAAFREENTTAMYNLVRSYLGNEFGDFTISIHASRFLIEDLIPNIYRNGKYAVDRQRKSPDITGRPVPVVENISRPYRPSKGLYSKNVLVWPSHGWYYSAEDDRWLWQRPRLFEAVEDKIPMSFVLPYLVPMLENSGANVFVPRERDIQINEVITDNDDTPSKRKPSYRENSKSKTLKWKTSAAAAFAYGTPPYPEGYNPFLKGTSRFIETDTVSNASASWVPDIPETGEYAVYISYTTAENSIDDALYTVNHSGGSTEFRVNQKIGGSTWIYLGKFRFLKGYNPANASVVLTNKSVSGKAGIISADAVRFGGGMGIVSRNGKTSGRPKFLEGSRYWLQFAGMPDTLVYSMRKNRDDYSDDFMSRSEYGNYLKGAPYGPNRMPLVKGLGIPVDLSLALHTDAGITHSDTAIGTLSIYASDSRDKSLTFPDGQSRMASRDLADIVQSQIVEDIRKEFDPIWPRRQLMDGNYYEARSTNYPSVLVELLSHQNYQDMKYMLDPRFQFLVARSIYKSMLRFLAYDHSESYAIQPLPVTHFSAVLSEDGSANLKWRPQSDPLEPAAEPVQYIVYTRMDNGDFDNGQLTATNELVIPKLKKGVIYSFKVTALNDGGESFPSEILSVCNLQNGKAPVLIINGFDRICGPAGVYSPEYTGFPENGDAGVPDKYLLSYTGAQYNFNPSSGFVSNDAPGHGASYADHETEIIAGNSFDYPFIHGKALAECGYSFCSVSNESVWDSLITINSYRLIDLILGEQKETRWQKSVFDSLKGTSFKAFPSSFQRIIENYCKSGGNFFVSGAYCATDLIKDKPRNHPDIIFANEVLKISWATDHAAKSGNVFAAGNTFGSTLKNLSFNTSLSPKIYAVEAPDGIDPVKGSETILRYGENSFSAASGYRKDYGVIVFGFPFETINDESSRTSVMREIIKYFGINK